MTRAPARRRLGSSWRSWASRRRPDPSPRERGGAGVDPPAGRARAGSRHADLDRRRASSSRPAGSSSPRRGASCSSLRAARRPRGRRIRRALSRDAGSSRTSRSTIGRRRRLSRRSRRIADAALAAGLRRDDALVAVGGGVDLRRRRVRGGDPAARRRLERRADDDGSDGRRGDRRKDRRRPPRRQEPARRLPSAARRPDRPARRRERCPSATFAPGSSRRSRRPGSPTRRSRRGRSARSMRILAREEAALLDLLAGAARGQGRDRASDPREGGRRRLLNFGHTLGHALEAAGELPATCGTARRWPGASPRRSRSPAAGAGLSETERLGPSDGAVAAGPVSGAGARSRRPRAVSRARQEGDRAGHRGRAARGGRPRPRRGGVPAVGMAGRGGYNVSQVNSTPRAVSDPPLCARFRAPWSWRLWRRCCVSDARPDLAQPAGPGDAGGEVPDALLLGAGGPRLRVLRLGGRAA